MKVSKLTFANLNARQLVLALFLFVCWSSCAVAQVQSAPTRLERISPALNFSPNIPNGDLLLFNSPQAAFAAFVDYQSAQGNCKGDYCSTYTNFSPCPQQTMYWWGKPLTWCVDQRDYFTPTGKLLSETTGPGAIHTHFMPCPSQFNNMQYNITGTGSYADPAMYAITCQRYVTNEQIPDCDCGFGNPIYAQDASKRQQEVDFRSRDGELEFVRYYNSDRMNFTSNYSVTLLLPSPQPSTNCYSGAYSANSQLFSYCFPYVSNTGEAQIRVPSGFVYRFAANGTSFSPVDPFLTSSLVQQAGNGTGVWTYHDATSDQTMTFDSGGNLLRIDERNGRYQVLTYSDSSTATSVAPGAGYLIAVSDNFNRALHFTYDANGNMLALIDPAGQTTSYAYEAADTGACFGSGCYRLSTVTYPDGAVKTYHWNEAANVSSPPSGGYNYLTGITDENGQRYSSYTYKGALVVSTSLSGGVNSYTLSNFTLDQTSTVTDPLGTVRTFNYGAAQGLVRLASVTGGACPQCEAQAQTFDANGNVASRTDFNGTKTTYVYELSRNLETSRTEAAGTAQARAISTVWHPTYRLPTQITEPNRVTNFTYDANGNLLTKSVTAGGSTRTWTYTYNNFGQVLTATDPDSNKTTYTYDTSGNLTSLTDAKGHITQYTSYDANGNLLAMTDPNGQITTFTWDARNRLKSRQSGSDLTTYVYDPVGQLIQVTLPDNSTVTYSYDPAHRLTGVSDSHGNSISYTLDAAGNHTREDVTDPAGQLAAAQAQVAASQQGSVVKP